MGRIVYLILFILIFITSCKNDNSLNPEEYIQWVNNESNGLIVSKEIGKYIFEIKYNPIDYLILKDIKNLTPEIYNKEKMERKYLQYYTFRIKLKNSSGDVLKEDLIDNEEYYRRIEYLSFIIQQDLNVIEGNDTLPCLLNHFERTYGITPYITIMLGFELRENNIIKEDSLAKYDKIFIYNDKIFNSGIVKLILKSKDINNIPNLIIK